MDLIVITARLHSTPSHVSSDFTFEWFSKSHYRRCRILHVISDHCSIFRASGNIFRNRHQKYQLLHRSQVVRGLKVIYTCIYMYALLFATHLLSHFVPKLREMVEEETQMSLKEWRQYFDEEMLTILGQMDSPSLIFDHLYLVSTID